MSDELPSGAFCGTRGLLFSHVYEKWALWRRKQPSYVFPKDPRILLCCIGHLGDVWLAASILPQIKKHWPHAKIGFLTSPESASLCALFPEIDAVHIVENGYFSLRSHPIHGIYSWMSVRPVAKGQYDLSFEMHPFFPNAIPYVWEAEVPMRVGFNVGGFSRLLSHPVSMPLPVRYLPNYYPLLLEALGVPQEKLLLKPAVSHTSLVNKIIQEHGSYLVIHMGSSDSRKEWDEKEWKKLSQMLTNAGYFLIFTGKGEKEKQSIRQVRPSKSLDLCDRISLEELCDLVRRSSMVISVDSFPIHIAAHFQIPFIGLYLYSHGVELWLPDSCSCRLIVSQSCATIDPSNPPAKAVFALKVDAAFVYPHVLELLHERNIVGLHSLVSKSFPFASDAAEHFNSV